jgi:lipopolysaccharide/colanic/teichoic acid biosynthesis glycosyltransferase
MPEKLRINLDYAAQASLIGDFRVILMTLGLWPNGKPKAGAEKSKALNR